MSLLQPWPPGKPLQDLSQAYKHLWIAMLAFQDLRDQLEAALLLGAAPLERVQRIGLLGRWPVRSCDAISGPVCEPSPVMRCQFFDVISAHSM